jgi:hypothetical protein
VAAGQQAAKNLAKANIRPYVRVVLRSDRFRLALAFSDSVGPLRAASS